MTTQQISLLKSAIMAHAAYRRTRVQRFRWVEVGRIAGVDPRTARTLIEVGLLEAEVNENHHLLVALHPVLWRQDETL